MTLGNIIDEIRDIMTQNIVLPYKSQVATQILGLNPNEIS